MSITIEVSSESRRGCGYRSPDATGVGVYMMAEGKKVRCGSMPFVVSKCAACGGGIHQARGWTWVKPRDVFVKDDVGRLLRHLTHARDLLSGPTQSKAVWDAVGNTANAVVLTRHLEAALSEWESVDTKDVTCGLDHCGRCPMGGGMPDGYHGLLWVGEAHYPTPEAFIKEANAMGISKKLGAIPRDVEEEGKAFELGTTWVYFVHPHGATRLRTKEDGGVETVHLPAVVYMAQPTRLDLVVDVTDPEDLTKAQRQRIEGIMERVGEDKVRVVKVERETDGLKGMIGGMV